MVTRVLLDTDPGIDDAVALLVALACPAVDVVGVTTVHGNVDLDQTTRNAWRLLGLARRTDVPLARGAEAPLAAEPTHARHVHGGDGLGDLEWLDDPVRVDSRSPLDLLDAVGTAAPVTLVAVGPLTNVARLLAGGAEVGRRPAALVVMGGGARGGNVTAAAEFNVFADPEAAAAVLSSGQPLTLLPLEVTHQGFVTDGEIDQVAGHGGEVARRVAAMLRPYADAHERRHGDRQLPLHDALAVFAAVEPDAFTFQSARVAVSLAHDDRRGRTTVTWDPDGPVRVAVTVDRERFVRFVLENLARYRD